MRTGGELTLADPVSTRSSPELRLGIEGPPSVYRRMIFGKPELGGPDKLSWVTLIGIIFPIIIRNVHSLGRTPFGSGAP